MKGSLTYLSAELWKFVQSTNCRGLLNGVTVKRFRFNFGPGTKFSLAVVAGICVWQYAVQPQSPSQVDFKSRVTHEAIPPLHKPEPRELLARNLTPSQRKQIEKICLSWEAEKESLLASLGEASGSRPGRQDLASLKSVLSGYSELSRLYNTRRETAWQKALAAAKGGESQEDDS